MALTSCPALLLPYSLRGSFCFPFPQLWKALTFKGGLGGSGDRVERVERRHGGSDRRQCVERSKIVAVCSCKVSLPGNHGTKNIRKSGYLTTCKSERHYNVPMPKQRGKCTDKTVCFQFARSSILCDADDAYCRILFFSFLASVCPLKV